MVYQRYKELWVTNKADDLAASGQEYLCTYGISLLRCQKSIFRYTFIISDNSDIRSSNCRHIIHHEGRLIEYHKSPVGDI